MTEIIIKSVVVEPTLELRFRSFHDFVHIHVRGELDVAGSSQNLTGPLGFHCIDKFVHSTVLAALKLALLAVVEIRIRFPGPAGELSLRATVEREKSRSKAVA